MARLNHEVERSHDSPMDYAWSDGRGPVDSSSPFMQAPRGAPAQNASTSHKSKPPWRRLFKKQSRDADCSELLGPSSELDSPSKPDLPKLRNPEGQRYLFNTLPSGKSNWDAYSKNSAFTTPRKLAPEIEDTSGAEQSSPAYADSEATPDPPPRAASPSKSQGALVKFKANKDGEKDDKRSDSSSWFKKSGKGGIFKRSGYNDLLQRKVDKRRRRVTDKDVQNAPRRHSNDSDGEERPSSSDHYQQSHRPRGGSAQSMGFIPSVLTFIDAHPSLPSTLSYYVQFILNCVFAGCLILVLWGVFSTIKNDINERAMMESSDILAEMAGCARSFKENRCELDTRVPAMESVCNGWEKCMTRDPYKVGRSRLSAGMFAEIFNSFIEPISVKALVRHSSYYTGTMQANIDLQVVSISVIIGCFAVNNLTFGIYRSKHNSPPPPHPPPAPSQPAYMGHQSHPQLGFASPGYGQYHNPYQHQLNGMPPPNGGAEWQEEGSPSKRLGYR